MKPFVFSAVTSYRVDFTKQKDSGVRACVWIKNGPFWKRAARGMWATRKSHAGKMQALWFYLCLCATTTIKLWLSDGADEQWDSQFSKGWRGGVSIRYESPFFPNLFSLLFLSLPHHFFASHRHSFYYTTTNERTNEKTKEPTSKRRNER
jgi:hypothetical protein